jgi:hypothetical protein
MKIHVISHVRMKSAAGWYLGSIEFNGEDAFPYDRDSGYYPSEELVKSEYPRSIGQDEAFQKAIVYKWYKEDVR